MIQVPQGMLMACEATPGNRDTLSGTLRAALGWLTEHPIVPTDEQAAALWAIGLEQNPDKNETTHAAKNLVLAWQRIMFLAPQPDVAQMLRQIRYDLAHRPEKTSLGLVVEHLDDILRTLDDILGSPQNEV